MFDYARLESDLAVLRSARDIIAAATGSARLASMPRLNPDIQASTDIGIGVEYLDAAMDKIDEAISTICVHMPSFTPPSAHMDIVCTCGAHDSNLCLNCESMEAARQDQRIREAEAQEIAEDLDPEPHGTRDTFVPHPHEPATCEQCAHTLRMDHDGRCVHCGYEH